MKNNLKKVENALDLSEALMEVWNSVRAEKMPFDMAKNLANVAGKLTAVNTRQMEYDKHMGITETIPFFTRKQ